MTPDRPTLGILLMLGFCVMAPMGDGMAKWIGTGVPLLQLVGVRFGVQFLLLLPLALTSAGGLRLDARGYWLTALRTVLHIAGIALMFLSLRFLPLADAVAIAFVMPFIMLFLGWLVLAEEGGPRRMIACAGGFAGTLLVTQPSFVEVGWPALLPMGVALIFALFMLVTRLVARRADPIRLQTVSGGMASLLLVPLLMWFDGSGWSDLDPIWPDTDMMIILLFLGVLGTVAHLFMTWSLRFAPAATLAPMQYLEIPIAALIGWLVFSEFPDGLALIGIGIVIGAGLYIIWREHALQERPADGSAAG